MRNTIFIAILSMVMFSCTNESDGGFEDSIECTKRQVAISEAYERAIQGVTDEKQLEILYEQFRIDLLNSCQ